MPPLAHSIETYIRAKDGNRPHLIADAFAPDATLDMTLQTSEIAFPSRTEGADAIARVLVSEFAQRYENVYTLCIGTAPESRATFDCDWLVCMTEKGGGAARVGFGRYEWRASGDTGRVTALHIVIEAMHTLPAQWSAEILGWAPKLPYPWCPREALSAGAPAFEPVQSVLRALAQRA
ncbi:MAG TPA: nuclear transport factor 2 family protein [Paraburkholderia sp.]|nr:nuclear transport factor 2 family protein [Paraburkholderia sp.]